MLESDVLDFMWRHMNFYKLIDSNREVYTVEFGTMSEKILINIIENLKILRDLFLEIINEVKD